VPQIAATIVAVTSIIPTGGIEPVDETVRGTITTTASDSSPAATSLTTSDGVAATSRSEGSAATSAVKRRGRTGRYACA